MLLLSTSPNNSDNGKKNIKIKILYFAQLRESVGGKNYERLILKDKTSVNELLSMIAKKYSASNFLKSINISVNCELVNKDTFLRDCDEVALLPPVTGG